MHRVFCSPLRYVQGEGVTTRLAAEMAVIGLAGPVLVVAGRSVERIIEANTLLSGLGFESAGLGAAHAVHNGLTVLHGTPAALHGEKVAFGTLVQLVLDGTPAEEFATLVRFCRAVGLPVTLAELGLPAVTAADIDRIAVRATQPGETIHNLPRPVTPAEVAAAIREADARAAGIALWA